MAAELSAFKRIGEVAHSALVGTIRKNELSERRGWRLNILSFLA